MKYCLLFQRGMSSDSGDDSFEITSSSSESEGECSSIRDVPNHSLKKKKSSNPSETKPTSSQGKEKEDEDKENNIVVFR